MSKLTVEFYDAKGKHLHSAPATISGSWWSWPRTRLYYAYREKCIDGAVVGGMSYVKPYHGRWSV